MWMAVYLVSVLLFKLGVEFMRLNLLVVDSQHIHTSQDIYEMMIFLLNFISKFHFCVTFHGYFSIFFLSKCKSGEQ